MHTVLAYHSITSRSDQISDEAISPQRFEQQLRWLSRRRTVVPLIETLHRSEKDRLVGITFDDGYRNNLTVALPLLEKFSLPMTLFVIAGSIDGDGYLSTDELREISRHPLVTIGAHGLWHRHFTQLSPDEARFELSESRLLLEEIVGQRVELMAWPYGECDPKLALLRAECGYRASWSVWKGTNGPHSRWRVPLGRRDNLFRFIAKSAGVYALSEAKWHRFQDRRKRKSVTEPASAERFKDEAKTSVGNTSLADGV